MNLEQSVPIENHFFTIIAEGNFLPRDINITITPDQLPKTTETEALLAAQWENFEGTRWPIDIIHL